MDFEVSPHQRDFLGHVASGKRVVLFRGGLQSGKSVAGAAGLGDLIWRHKIQLPEQVAGQMHPEVWILSRTHGMADTAFGYFRWLWGKYILDEKQCHRLGLVRSDSRTWWLDPRDRPDRMPLRLRVRSTSDPENLRATSNLLVALADECAHWKDMAWKNLSGRAVVTPTRFLVTTTPRGKNWLFRDIHTPAVSGDADFAEVHCRSEDSKWADKGYILKLRQLFGAQYAAQELDAEFVEFEGQVYTFEEARTLCDAPAESEYEKVVIGGDPGFRDPYAVGFWGLKDGVWYRFDELYCEGKTTKEVSSLIRGKLDREPDVMWWDARKPEDIAVMRHDGWNCKPNRTVYSEGRTLQIRPGIQLVQSMLSEGTLRVDRNRCPMWLQEVYRYAYRDRDERNRGENPVDAFNHAMDECLVAGTMVAAERGLIPIEEIETGERVWTQEGLREVEFSGMANPCAKTFEVQLSDGRKLTGTRDHPVYCVGEGWKGLDKVRISDMLLSCSATWWNSVAEGTTGGLEGDTGLVAKELDSIAPFGCFTMEPFRRDSRFITRVGTTRTTGLKISLSCPPRITPGITRRNSMTGRRSIVHAINAEGCMSRALTVERDVFARTCASRHGEGRNGLTSFPSVALFAQKSPLRTSIKCPELVPVRVVGVLEKGRAPVFDLTVSAVHHFFANGVLVHNTRYVLVSECGRDFAGLHPRYRVPWSAIPASLQRDGARGAIPAAGETLAAYDEILDRSEGGPYRRGEPVARGNRPRFTWRGRRH